MASRSPRDVVPGRLRGSEVSVRRHDYVRAALYRWSPTVIAITSARAPRPFPPVTVDRVIWRGDRRGAVPRTPQRRVPVAELAAIDDEQVDRTARARRSAARLPPRSIDAWAVQSLISLVVILAPAEAAKSIPADEGRVAFWLWVSCQGACREARALPPVSDRPAGSRKLG
jgi:hypothetical protein